MKQKFLFLLFLLLALFENAQGQITIDLSTGKHDDGTLMSAPPPDVTNGTSTPDPDWSVIRPNETSPVTTRTRHTYGTWSTPVLGITGNTLQSRWISDVDISGSSNGDFYYYSKSFTIPNGATNALLNLRTLSSVRNWTYLVRTDVTPNTEELITWTTWMSDGAKGWLNSRSPEVINKPLSAGTYKIKVRVYTNSGVTANALNVHSIVQYTPCTPPSAPVVTNITQPTCATAASVTLSGLPSTGTYNILANGTTVLSNQTGATKIITNLNPNTTYYFAIQNSSTNCISDNSSNTVINSIPPKPVFTTSTIQPCGNTTGTITINPLTDHVYRMNNGTYAATNSFSGLANGTYSLQVKNTLNGCESDIQSISIAPITLSGSSTICAGSSEIFTPSMLGGIWSSNSLGVATVNASSGLVTGISQGSATITYLHNGCPIDKTITVNSLPNKPTVTTITQPSCLSNTGSVTLSNLPAPASWTITASPGGATISGSTATAIFTGLQQEKEYTFTVKNNATGCTSLESSIANIDAFSTTISGKDKICKNTDGTSNALSVPSNLTGLWSYSPPINNITITVPNATKPYEANLNYLVNASVSVPTTITVTFTPSPGNPCTAPITKSIVVAPNNITPTFSNIPASICFGTSFTLPATSSNQIALSNIPGTWLPTKIDSTITTSYSFTPMPTLSQSASYCFDGTAVSIEVSNGIERFSGDIYQRVNAGTAIHDIFYKRRNNPASISWKPAPPAGITAGYVTEGVNNFYKISGTPTVPGTYTYTIKYTSSICPDNKDSGKIIVTSNDAIDWTLAPNSYMFIGVNETNSNQAVDGIKIPIKKAFAMWEDDRDPLISLKSPIPTGSQLSAYVYWEDVSGLVKSSNNYKLNFDIASPNQDAKILVPIDKTKGKGNAVISLHAGGNGNSTDDIIWTWHVWVTDDPRLNGSTYNQGYEKNKNKSDAFLNWKWMDRNLGATNADFRGKDWNKSAGLMYQWGRKDAIPPMSYKDGTRYEINGVIGRPKYNPFTQDNNSPFGWKIRPNNNSVLNNHSEVVQNLRYSIQNPLKIITYTSFSNETWFSDQEYRIIGKMNGVINTTRITWDLWSDNRNGLFSQQGSSSAEVDMDSKTYELKSPYDPCPCGWRIPSHHGASLGIGSGNNSSPWGRYNSGFDDDQTAADSKFPIPNPGNSKLSNVKVYPSLGFDFSEQNNLPRNIGLYPISGGYIYLGPNEISDYRRTDEGVGYINWLSTSILPTASYSPWNGFRGVEFLADYKANPNAINLGIYVNQSWRTKGAGAVRCIKDPNDAFMPPIFKTEYILPTGTPQYSIETLKEWSKEPNSHVIQPTETSISFDIKKAIAMYKLYLTENDNFPSNLSVSIQWSTGANLIATNFTPGSLLENSQITVNRTVNMFGNAVVALHNGTDPATSPVLWSWHIWLPKTDPFTTTTTHETEIPVDVTGLSPSGHVRNNTYNLIAPPLKTTFMDRNLGALIALASNVTTISEDDYKISLGLHYQWGRKDPIPNFFYSDIYRNGSLINGSTYSANFIKNYSNYSIVAGVQNSDKRSSSVRKVMKYSAENPLIFMNQDITSTGTNNQVKPKDWISSDQGIAYDRWGHATEKSPFDPCPRGWRIPDHTFSAASSYTSTANYDYGVKGTSPWYLGGLAITDPRSSKFKGISQIHPASAADNYMGVLVRRTSNAHAGWIFSGSNNSKPYTIGNYPIAGTRIGASTDDLEIGVWSSSMSDGMNGGAFGLRVKSGIMYSGQQLDPHQAMSCRCAKINSVNGVEQGPILKLAKEDAPKAAPTQPSVQHIVLYPNPVKDILGIDVDDNKEYNYQIYSQTGQRVLEGQFENKKTNLSSLNSGMYIIRINNQYSFKIIKE